MKQKRMTVVIPEDLHNRFILHARKYGEFKSTKDWVVFSLIHSMNEQKAAISFKEKEITAERE